MTKSEALAKIYATYSQEELLYAKDEPDDDTIDRLLGARGIPVDTYTEIQREFGWDDTH